VKRWLCETSLAQMKITLAREQTLAEEQLGALQGAALGEILLVGDQNIPDQVGMIE
jgi:hypothetical protein